MYGVESQESKDQTRAGITSLVGFKPPPSCSISFLCFIKELLPLWTSVNPAAWKCSVEVLGAKFPVMDPLTHTVEELKVKSSLLG
jgi:hypothetical protein